MAMATPYAIATATRWRVSKRAVAAATTRAMARAATAMANGIKEGVDGSNKEGNGDRRRGQWQRWLVGDKEGNGEGGNKCNGDGDNLGVAVATIWRVTKWAMARATRAIVTNAVATVAVILASAVMAAAVVAAAATTITQRHCPQCSHCSSCRHSPPF